MAEPAGGPTRDQSVAGAQKASCATIRLPFIILVVWMNGVVAVSQQRVAHVELSDSIRLLNERLSHLPTANGDPLRLVQERSRLLSKLIESHPGEAISLAFSPGHAARLAAALPDAASQIESG